MGNLDIKTKEYTLRPAVFADLFNYLLYDGKEIIKPEDLKDSDTSESLFFNTFYNEKENIQRYRDVLKNVVIKEDEEKTYLLYLGIENQSDTHYAMPLRVMLYDALNYARQVTVISSKHKKEKDIKEKEEFLSGFTKKDKIRPVITLVVHFSVKKWDGPLSLEEMLSPIDKRIKPFIQNYSIHLISPVSMDMKEIKKFRSDFKELASLINCRNDKMRMEELLKSEEALQHMDYLTASIANDVAKTGLKFTKEEEENMEVNIAKAWADNREEGFIEGRTAGIAEGRTAGIAEGRTAGIAEGRTAGIMEGVNNFSKLINDLLSQNRIDDIRKVSQDEAYRDQLLKEFHLNKIE